MEVQNSEYWINRPKDDTYRDWKTDSPSWIEEYWRTKNHPHRKQIINILRKLQPWTSLLEIGCNCGVNLANIKKKFGEVDLAGIDTNKDAIEFAKKKLPDINFTCGDIENLEIGDYEIVLVDATFMYVSPTDILSVMEKVRKAKKAIILCEWYDKDRLGILKGGHYARNYSLLLKEFGWKVREKKIIWPSSQKWMDFGRIFIATK